MLVGFHGYGQVAEDMLEQLRLIPGTERWSKASIQALHPFYTRGDSKVVASWMTRQDRDLAIGDNVRYVQAAFAALRTSHVPRAVLVGFSQGAAMAYRAALHSAGPVSGVVALAGDIPPELKADDSLVWPRVLVGVGSREEWYAGDKLDADLAFLRERAIDHQVVRFDGGHEWTDGFRAAVGEWLSSK